MTNIIDVIRVIEKMAPILAKSIAKMNPVSDALYTLISEVFNANRNDPNDMIAKINSDPECETKLKKIEAEHEESLKRDEVEDRENARNREIELTKITGKRDYISEVIAVFIVIGFFCICGLLIFNPATLQDKSMITTPLIAAFMIVVHYYF